MKRFIIIIRKHRRRYKKKISLQERQRKRYNNKNRYRDCYTQSDDGPGQSPSLWNCFGREKPTSISFCSVCFVSCEKPVCCFQYFKLASSSNVNFQNFDIRVCKMTLQGLYDFSLKNVSILTSGCNLNNGAPEEVLRKSSHFS